MVELMVVMLLVAIISAIAIRSVSSSRATGQRFNAVAAAQAYANAVDRFARDHGGRYPNAPGVTAGGVVDWPAGKAAKRGPYAPVLGASQFYMPAPPESVQDSTVKLGTKSTTYPTITYRPLGAQNAGYEFRVTIPGRDDCVLTGGDDDGAAAVATCARR